ncbi:hypothetical protein [Roseobacter ponti]|uniref:Uncharacterized protein n=1 Tax=Roseobacter ponti TaxID=1891787 RepID=A0A858SX58_9RHOB|nr:hypothetical protein [Roseobacter ponti]QJF51466.1 hypothetical protein G3256_09985 [Roseobacter ponti]
MSEIDELQSRILAAMDRVAQGVDALAAPDTSQTDDLRKTLEDEKARNAALSEQVETLTRQQQENEDAVAAQVSGKVASLDTQLQKLRRANAQLTEACDALRRANAEGVGEPHLINKSMMAELEAIKAMRNAEMAEADEIIAALTPLLESVAGSDMEGTA